MQLTGFALVFLGIFCFFPGLASADEPARLAITRGLEWLAAHQNPDGCWSFSHRHEACPKDCADVGTRAEDKVGATSLTLLAFLGAGHNHREGRYKQVVNRGLTYLVVNMVPRDGAGTWKAADNELSHAWATYALCEAYGMTRDRELLVAAQNAVNFIISAQDKTSGGWRPANDQPPTVTLTAWNVTALVAAYLSNLEIKPDPSGDAIKYLNWVQMDGGARYGCNWMDDHASTAAGLMCRMVLGWDSTHEAVQRGAKFLLQEGLPRNDLQGAYFADVTMALIQGDQPWVTWRDTTRRTFLSTQVMQGHNLGSWYWKRDRASPGGGRLYCTAMSLLLLEVPARFRRTIRLPDVDFPL